MTITRNMTVLGLASIGLTVLYVVVPMYMDSKAVREQWFDALWSFYLYVLPGIVGVAVALLLSGAFPGRFARIVYALGLPVVIAFFWSGKAGVDLDAFRVSMIFLAVTGAIYIVAGAVAAFAATRQ